MLPVGDDSCNMWMECLLGCADVIAVANCGSLSHTLRDGFCHVLKMIRVADRTQQGSNAEYRIKVL